MTVAAAGIDVGNGLEGGGGGAGDCTWDGYFRAGGGRRGLRILATGGHKKRCGNDRQRERSYRFSQKHALIILILGLCSIE